MMDNKYKDSDYSPAIQWVTREEICVRQEVYAVRECRPSHADPTADEAIGRLMREDRREKRKQQCSRKPFCRPKIGVWRWDDEQRNHERRRQDV